MLIILNYGCTKNEFRIIDNRNKPNSSDIDFSLAAGESLINFTSNIINTYISTGYGASSAVQPFPKRNRAQVYVTTSQNHLIDDPLYQALTEGTLSPVSNPIIVATGTYNFYITSVNTPDDPPIMNNFEIYPVDNGIDYLWFEDKLTVASKSATVPVTFTHSTAQVVIRVNNLDSIGLAEWIS